MKKLIAACMAECGLSRTSDPEPGDVGLVRDGAGKLVMAIRTGGAWAVKTESGVLIEDLPLIAAWRVG